MRQDLLGLVVLVVVGVVGCTVVSNGKGEWSHTLDLMNTDGIHISWKNLESDQGDGNKWFVMEVKARTNGYVGVGFSPHGGMTGADIVIGWVDSNGTPHLKDFYGEKNGMPLEDKEQNYELLSAEEKGEWTIVKFRRRWDTCDPNDMALRTDTMRLIWGYGTSDPTVNANGKLKMDWHGVNGRGAKSVFISDESFPAPFPDEAPELYPNVKVWDMLMDNNTIEAEHTTYFCKIVKFPDLDRKHHMIGWKPILTPENSKNVHHITFYECMIPPEHGGTASVFEDHLKITGGRCYTKNMPPEWTKHCVTFLFVWVAGSEGEMMPSHVGSPLGEEHGGATYFMMEVHYDNPTLKTFADQSGVRIFYTDQLRENDGSIMLMGYRITPFLLLPPKQDNFVTHGICASECTEQTVPPGGVHIIQTLLHAHVSGRKLRLRHFRNGTELPLVAEDNYYDFNYQQSRTLQNEVTILAGDELITECEYQTLKNNRIVLGGLSTTQEMCQSFFIYYPRVNWMQCTSQYEFHDFFKGLGIDGVNGSVLASMRMPYDPAPTEEFDPPDNAKELEEIGDGASFQSVFDHIHITAPEDLRGKTVGQHLKDIDWKDGMPLAKNMQEFWKQGKHYAYCTGHGRKRHALKNHVIPYPTIKKPLNKDISKVCQKDNYKYNLRQEAAAPSGSSVSVFPSAVATTAFVAVFNFLAAMKLVF